MNRNTIMPSYPRAALLLFGMILLVLGCDQAEKPQVAPVMTANLLPATAGGELNRTSEVSVFTGEALFEHINGGAEVYHKYGFVDVATAYYKSGETEIMLDVYSFDTPDHAFGLYSTLRPPEINAVSYGVEGFASAQSITFVKGVHIIKTVGYDETPATTSLCTSLAQAMDSIITAPATLTGTFTRLPSDAAIPFSRRLDAESFLGEAFLDEVYSTGYIVVGDTVKLFVTLDPSGEKFKQLETKYADQPKSGLRPADAGFDTNRSLLIDNSYYGQIVAGTRAGYLVGIIGYEDRHLKFLGEWLYSIN